MKIGNASIFVKGKGNFEATKTITFRIVPKATTVKLSLYGYDDVKVTWNKVPQASGYRVYYRKAGSSSWITKGYYTGTEAKLPNLADGAKYEVAVRPYKVVGKTRYYAPYKTASIYT